MADMYVPQSRKGVEVAFARAVDDLGTLATHHNEGLRVIRGVIQRMDQVLAVDAQNLINVGERFGSRSLDHAGGFSQNGIAVQV